MSTNADNSPMTTNNDNEVATPRVDELDYNQEIKSYRIWDLAREFEREVARLREELAEIKDGMKFIMDENCAESEVHCGCVPLLKISFKKSQQEVARLREELSKAMSMIDRDMECEAEVARLRELLNRAIEMLTAVTWGDEGRDFDWQKVMKELHKLKAEARLAPAPEEPVSLDSASKIPHEGNVHATDKQQDTEVARLRDLLNRALECLKVYGGSLGIAAAKQIFKELAPSPEEPNSISTDLKHKNKENTVSLNEWRELGPDEVIQEGDEYFWEGRWYWPNKSIGLTPEGAGLRFRTRRPLPVQNEWRQLGPDEVIGAADEYNPASLGEWIKVPHGWIGEKCDITKVRTRRPLPKKEEMPLEKDQVIDYCRRWADKHLTDHGKETFYARLGLLVDFAIDLYRDEIEKLKQK